MYHLKLVKGASYTGIVSATAKKPDVFVDSKAKADAAIASGFFELVEDEKPAKKVESPEEAPAESAAAAPKVVKRTKK